MLMTAITPDTVATTPARAFLSALVWIKGTGAGTAGTMSMVEIKAPAGWESPWHVHHTHDEYFYILEGSVTAKVGDKVVVLRAGDFAFGPRAVPHGYRVSGDGPARLLMITGDRDFAEFVQEVSTPATGETLPQPFEGDLAAIAARAEARGMTILGDLSDVLAA